MIPASLNITIYQGDDFSLIFRMKDSTSGAYLDLTDKFSRAQIRPDPSSSEILATFSAEPLDQTAAPGGVELRLTPTQTAALPASGGFWDVEVHDATNSWVRTPLAGSVTVIREVTR